MLEFVFDYEDLTLLHICITSLAYAFFLTPPF